MAKHKHKSSQNHPILLVFLWVFGLSLLFAMLLYGTDIALLNPKGYIADEQYKLLVFTAIVLMLIAVPTLAFLYFFAWKYRETNKKAKYEPDRRHGKAFVFGMWAVPSVFAIVLAIVMWSGTHKLDPRKSLASDKKPLTVQVVALRWKWVFIYPEQKIATVNFVQAPVGTPIEFDLTADEAPMSSFWIPHWGGQLYAMTGHANKLNLMPEAKGDYTGSSAEINGEGFAGMKFTARASSEKDFDKWIQKVKKSPNVLSVAEYEKLLKPTENNQAAFYSSTDADLYDTVLMKYMGSHEHNMGQEE
jgi:cytochrome o ubiquinol oxidase subunit 2